MVGNDVCGGPCVETIDFRFQVVYTQPIPDVQLYVAQALPGWTLTSTGPLSPFNSLTTSENYFALFNATGVEIDLDGPFGDGELTNEPFPVLVGAELYGCGNPLAVMDQICVTDFAPPGGPSFGHVFGFGVTYTVTGSVATPEPTTGILVLVGAGLWALARKL
jgi:hypothetical protein